MYNPAIAVQGVYSRKIRTFVCTDEVRQLFKDAWFVIAQNWKQPK